jgi:hypothetical protein
MANLHKPAHSDTIGYDEDHSLQLMLVKKRARFYLVGGSDLDVSTDDDKVASVIAGAGDDLKAHKDKTMSDWEKGQVIRDITLVANAVGTTQLRATSGGRDMIDPLTVRVIDDATLRQVGNARRQVTPELEKELKAMTLREAVLRVAEDQMHSKIGRSDGFGVYIRNATYDWCGGFAYWCWDQACAIRGQDNPFGGESSVLWSPQRAIKWAMEPTNPGQLLRYNGTNPMAEKKDPDYRTVQQYCDIGWNGNELEPADIVLFRWPNGDWRHVSMIYRTISQSTIETIDGNQGTVGTTNPSITVNKRDISNKVAGGLYEHAFVHVKGL